MRSVRYQASKSHGPGPTAGRNENDPRCSPVAQSMRTLALPLCAACLSQATLLPVFQSPPRQESGWSSASASSSKLALGSVLEPSSCGWSPARRDGSSCPTARLTGKRKMQTHATVLMGRPPVAGLELRGRSPLPRRYRIAALEATRRSGRRVSHVGRVRTPLSHPDLKLTGVLPSAGLCGRKRSLVSKQHSIDHPAPCQLVWQERKSTTRSHFDLFTCRTRRQGPETAFSSLLVLANKTLSPA